MISRIIRNVSRTFYRYPQVPEPAEITGPLRNLKIALVADYLTEACLTYECQVRNVTPQNYRDIFFNWKPDLLFVESAFHGINGRWRYELAAQPKWLRFTPQNAIARVVQSARQRRIPTVFWNKDDGLFFQHFIAIARHFDHIFTSDARCIEQYRQHVPASTTVHALMIPYQPAFHQPDATEPHIQAPCFAGSYYRGILHGRKQYLDMVFAAAGNTDTQVHVYDRNHDRFSRFLSFRFPAGNHICLHPRVNLWESGSVYKAHSFSINVNSVTDSPTMCSRRLLELLGCGRNVMTNSSPCVDTYFREFCHVADTPQQAQEVFEHFRQGLTCEDKERALEGARYVRSAHTWSHRLQDICAVCGL